MNPACPRHAVGHDAVLRISPQMGDDVLTHRESEDKVVTQIHRVAQSRPTSIGMTDLVSVSAHDEV
jgi:hypothetical protein